MSFWFKKNLLDIKKNILFEEIKQIKTVKNLYFWDLKDNININVLASTKIFSEDLISLDDKIIKLSHSNDYLEDQGYDISSIYFSKIFTKLIDKKINCWAISKDKKILHWGPISQNINDYNIIEQRAKNSAGKIKTSEDQKRNWYKRYINFLNNYYEDMPSGWYKIDGIKIKDILPNLIEI